MSERDDLKKKLLATYEQLVDQMLERLPRSEAVSLSDLERATGDLGSKLMQETLQSLVIDETDSEERPVTCPACGGKSHKRGKRRKQVISRHGEIEIERSYYVCCQCQGGFFPLDQRWGLNETAYSQEMGQQMTWLSGLLPFQQCQAVFWQLCGRLIPHSSIWRQTHYYGEKLWDYLQDEVAHVSVEQIRLTEARYDPAQTKGLAMDGGMVNIRHDGWREIKLAAVFDVAVKLERDPHTGVLGDYAHGVNIHYRALLGSKDEFAPQAWALAVKHQWPSAQERVVIGDGAAWIWALADDLCPAGWQIVDWFHATQHLAQAAQNAFPSQAESQKRALWLKTLRDHLYFGRLEVLLDCLKAQACQQSVTYFETHKRRMRYGQFRENGLPLGSGLIESGVKQVKHRVAAAGMRWNAKSLNPMLLIAGAVLANDFHTLWHDALAA